MTSLSNVNIFYLSPSQQTKRQRDRLQEQVESSREERLHGEEIVEEQTSEVRKLRGTIETLQLETACLERKLSQTASEKQEREGQIASYQERLEERRDLTTTLEAKIEKIRASFEAERQQQRQLIDAEKKKRKQQSR